MFAKSSKTELTALTKFLSVLLITAGYTHYWNIILDFSNAFLVQISEWKNVFSISIFGNTILMVSKFLNLWSHVNPFIYYFFVHTINVVTHIRHQIETKRNTDNAIPALFINCFQALTIIRSIRLKWCIIWKILNTVGLLL